jgi:hypothetical protein
MDDKIPDPKSDNAFADGFLNREIAAKAVAKLNRQTRVKLRGAPEARVLYTKENIVIDLSSMLGEGVDVYLIKNGELRRASIPIRWLD